MVHQTFRTDSIMMAQFNPSPFVLNDRAFFPAPSGSSKSVAPIVIPCFDASADVEGAASHVPHMDHFYDNSVQTAIMRDIAIDLEVLEEHLVLLGNQGVGKNKIVDR